MGYRRKGRQHRRATDQQDWATVCPTHGKRSYTSKADARRAARNSGATGAREFRCDAIDGHWHWGSLPPAVRRGRMDISEFRRQQGGGTAA